MANVAVYIDGYNVYYGLRNLWKERRRGCFYWLDYWKLGQCILGPAPLATPGGDRLSVVKYFTAIVENNPGKARRHQTYIDALRGLGQVEVIEGYYQSQKPVCKKCGFRWDDGEAKQTDVAIGAHLVCDGLRDVYDKAILITADSDQVPAIEMVRRETGKSIVIAYPPTRSNNQKLEAAVGGLTMSFNRWLAASQLDNPCVGTDGTEYQCPAEWL